MQVIVMGLSLCIYIKECAMQSIVVELSLSIYINIYKGVRNAEYSNGVGCQCIRSAQCRGY